MIFPRVILIWNSSKWERDKDLVQLQKKVQKLDRLQWSTSTSLNPQSLSFYRYSSPPSSSVASPPSDPSRNLVSSSSLQSLNQLMYVLLWLSHPFTPCRVRSIVFDRTRFAAWTVWRIGVAARKPNVPGLKWPSWVFVRLEMGVQPLSQRRPCFWFTLCGSSSSGFRFCSDFSNLFLEFQVQIHSFLFVGSDRYHMFLSI